MYITLGLQQARLDEALRALMSCCRNTTSWANVDSWRL
jgi:hypothetical protein